MPNSLARTSAVVFWALALMTIIVSEVVLHLLFGQPGSLRWIGVYDLNQQVLIAAVGSAAAAATSLVLVDMLRRSPSCAFWAGVLISIASFLFAILADAAYLILRTEDPSFVTTMILVSSAIGALLFLIPGAFVSGIVGVVVHRKSKAQAINGVRP